jgi:glycosyltransferase involved in cell wall biosynthesis
MKKKILFVHHGVGMGGASICLNEVLTMLRTDYDVTVLCLRYSDAVEYFRNSGFKVEVCESLFYKYHNIYIHLEGIKRFNLYGEILGIISVIFNILFFGSKELRRFDFDILYLNSLFLFDWSIIGKRLDKKVIVHVREPLKTGLFNLRKTIIRHLMNRNVDRIIAISRDNAKRVNLNSITSVIYDPLRKSISKGYSDQSKPSFKAKRFFRVLYLGGSSRIKGFYVLCRAIPLLDKNIEVVICGVVHDNSKNGIYKKIKALLVNYYIGRISHYSNISVKEYVSNVSEELQFADLLLFPSTVPHYANPIMEAYSCGVPVLASDVSGMDEIVNEKTGFMFMKGSHKDLALKLNEISLSNLTKQKESCEVFYKDIFLNNLCLKDILKDI